MVVEALETVCVIVVGDISFRIILRNFSISYGRLELRHTTM